MTPWCESNTHDIPTRATFRLDWHGCATALACDECATHEQLAWHQRLVPGFSSARCVVCRRVPASAADAVTAIPLDSSSPQADVAPCGEDAPSALSRDTATAEGVPKLPAPDAGGSS